jgi:hypothetical protein
MASLMNRLRGVLQDALGGPMTLPLPAGRCVMGVNLGGPSVEIQGHRWLGYDEAQAAGLQVPGAHTAATARRPAPQADAAVRTMLNTVVFRPRTLEISFPLPAGDYQLYLWIMENYQSHWHQLQLRLQGQVVAERLGDLAADAWQRHGPYAVRLQGEALSLSLDTGKDGIDAHLMGLSVYQPT